MAAETIARVRRPLRSDERAAVSYLVRFWLEPQETERESGLFRGNTRDLRTGEERYVGDPRSLSEHILRRIQALRQAEEAGSETYDVENAIG